MSRIYATGLGKTSFKQVFQHGLKHGQPASIGLAVAYISVSGVYLVKSLLDRAGVTRIRLVADTKDAVTHPNALINALSWGWEVKTINSLAGTFHPKLYVGGDVFDETKGFKNVTMSLVSSANISKAAFEKNGECTYLRVGSGTRLDVSAAGAWKACWDQGSPQDKSSVEEYAKFFALNNRHRVPFDLKVLGVSDDDDQISVSPSVKQQALPNSAATTAWAGLQSFTGDYNLQLEFPRDAGEVLRRSLSANSSGNTASFICDDGETRSFIFRFYEDNGMFRLNIRNDTPNAEWARMNHDGIAVVTCDAEGNAFRILKPGPPADDVINRSKALGTWGRTPTRLYGWY